MQKGPLQSEVIWCHLESRPQQPEVAVHDTAHSGAVLRAAVPGADADFKSGRRGSNASSDLPDPGANGKTCSSLSVFAFLPSFLFAGAIIYN